MPCFRPDIGQDEIEEVVATLKSGWLTTGPRVAVFEREFASAVSASDAVAVNSCTAALHLCLEALGVRAGDAVLVPTMTFAATAQAVRYIGALPILVDSEADTGNLSLADAAAKVRKVRAGHYAPRIRASAPIVGIIAVHVGGFMVPLSALGDFARQHGLWVLEDSAHAFPAAWRASPVEQWMAWGHGITQAACYSFYANKTITTGEGGIVVTNDAALAERVRLMALHGMSNEAWTRHRNGAHWDYRIVAAGFKYNLTDIAAAIGIHQLRRAAAMRAVRERIACLYLDAWASIDGLALPARCLDRIHSWHLFAIQLDACRLGIDRNELIERLRRLGVATSVHWRPLHLHPYFQEEFGWHANDCPEATRTWESRLSLPVFSAMTDAEVEHVIGSVWQACVAHSRPRRLASR